MNAHYHVLYSEDWPALALPSTPTQIILPEVDMDQGVDASELTFIVSVGEVTGSPSAWSVKVKPQFRAPTVRGSRGQFSRWFDLDEHNVAGTIAEGVGFAGPGKTAPTGGAFGIVADETTTPLPVTVQRTFIRFGWSMRLVAELQGTGGTTPAVKLAVNMITKG